MSEPAEKLVLEVSEALGEDVEGEGFADENESGEESDEYELAEEGDSRDFGEEEEEDDKYEGDGGYDGEEEQGQGSSLTAMLLGDPNAAEEEEEEEEEDEDEYDLDDANVAATNGKKRSRDDLAEGASEEPEGKKAKA
ncbi:hypothetical protein C0991_007504 [Blastosporella zonata]|nr:hypothetical protein C0991_007504 [Blastosporella zonata]